MYEQLHGFPRWTFTFNRAPNKFYLPSTFEEILPKVSSCNAYWQGAYMICLTPAFIGFLCLFAYIIIFFVRCFNKNNEQDRHLELRVWTFWFRNTFMCFGFIAIVAGVVFFIQADIILLKIETVLNNSFNFYDNLIKSGEDLVIKTLRISYLLEKVQGTLKDPDVEALLNQISKVVGSAHSFLNQAAGISWTPDLTTLQISTLFIIIQGIITFFCMFVFGLSQVSPLNRVNWVKSLKIPGYIFLFTAWLYTFMIFTSTVILSDVCHNPSDVILQVENQLSLKSQYRDIIKYYIQCTPGTSPPFKQTIENINEYMQGAELGIYGLQEALKSHPELREEVIEISSLFGTAETTVEDMITHTQCSEVHNFITQMLDFTCNDFITSLTGVWVAHLVFVLLIVAVGVFRCTRERPIFIDPPYHSFQEQDSDLMYQTAHDAVSPFMHLENTRVQNVGDSEKFETFLGKRKPSSIEAYKDERDLSWSLDEQSMNYKKNEKVEVRSLSSKRREEILITPTTSIRAIDLL